jgi:hypothetical protein
VTTRVTPAKAARVSTSARGGKAESAGSEASGAAARVPRQALAPLKHGGTATVALAPTVRRVKRELCKRLGVRYQDLTAAGREAVDLYARARAKLAAIDDWLTRNPMLDESGTPAPCLALYSTLLNTCGRLLSQVLAVLEQMAAEDARYDKAVQALIAEGSRTRAGQEAVGVD